MLCQKNASAFEGIKKRKPEVSVKSIVLNFLPSVQNLSLIAKDINKKTSTHSCQLRTQN